MDLCISSNGARGINAAAARWSKKKARSVPTKIPAEGGKIPSS
jgi:hypothetical protein